MPGVARPVVSRTVQVVVGVDTHRDQHVAVAVDQQGVHLGEYRLPVTMCGYRELERWFLGLDRSARSESRAPVPTALESHVS